MNCKHNDEITTARLQNEVGEALRGLGLEQWMVIGVRKDGKIETGTSGGLDLAGELELLARAIRFLKRETN